VWKFVVPPWLKEPRPQVEPIAATPVEESSETK
jgi:hypothetical protein